MYDHGSRTQTLQPYIKFSRFIMFNNYVEGSVYFLNLAAATLSSQQGVITYDIRAQTGLQAST